MRRIKHDRKSRARSLFSADVDRRLCPCAADSGGASAFRPPRGERFVLLAAAAFMLAAGGCRLTPTRGAAPVPGQGVVMYYFFTTTCEPCARMQPAINQLIQEGYPIRLVDCDAVPSARSQWAIRRVPTYVLQYGGGRSLRAQGLQSIDSLRTAFASIGYRPPQALPAQVMPQAIASADQPPSLPPTFQPPSTAAVDPSIYAGGGGALQQAINDALKREQQLAAAIPQLAAPAKLLPKAVMPDVVAQAAGPSLGEPVERGGGSGATSAEQSQPSSRDQIKAAVKEALAAAEQRAASAPPPTGSGTAEELAAAINRGFLMAVLVGVLHVPPGLAAWIATAINTLVGAGGLYSLNRLRVWRANKKAANPNAGGGADLAASQAPGFQQQSAQQQLAQSATRLGHSYEYGLQLIERHASDGRDPILDTTSGRLFDLTVDEWQTSKSPDVAAAVKELRNEVRERTYQIHTPAIITTNAGA